MRSPTPRAARPRNWPLTFIVTGLCLLGAAFLMGIAGASWFVMPNGTPRLLDLLGGICFWACMPVGFIGFVLLAIGVGLDARPRGAGLR